MPKTYAVPPPPHHNEGKTVAAWTMNLGIVLGALAIGIGMVVGDLDILIWVGAVVVAVSIVVGAVLSLAGLGQPRGYGEKQAAQTAVDSSDRNARSERPAEADAR
ncbi:MAG TPA: HGxxPAAW family protein [Brachybacterium sp.]|nr:HGxxPAAW family protein [Brachybacterium sp.]